MAAVTLQGHAPRVQTVRDTLKLSSASAVAKVWRWTIDKNPPDLMELRINEVRVSLPEFPTTRVDDRASVVWRSSWVSMEGFGQYRKIAEVGSVIWNELAFTRTRQVCNPFLPRRQPWWCESPLVLDLNRDGFKLSPEGVGVYFVRNSSHRCDAKGGS